MPSENIDLGMRGAEASANERKTTLTGTSFICSLTFGSEKVSKIKAFEL